MVEAQKPQGRYKVRFEEIFPVTNLGREWNVGKPNPELIESLKLASSRGAEITVYANKPASDKPIIEMLLQDQDVPFNRVETKPPKTLT